MFRHGGSSIVAHVLDQSVFVNSGSSGSVGIDFVKSGNNEWFGIEPSTDIDTVDLVDTPRPVLAERRGPRVGLSIVSERVCWIIEPCSTERIVVDHFGTVFEKDGRASTTSSG